MEPGKRRSPLKGYIKASIELQEAMRDEAGRPSDFRRLQQAHHNLRSERKHAIIEPLLEQAGQMTDPVQRNLIVTLAGVSDVLHAETSRFAYDIPKLGSWPPGSRGEAKSGSKDLRSLLAAADCIRSLSQTIANGRRK